MNTPKSRLGVVAFAALVALAIMAVGQGLWGLMVAVNMRFTPTIPWAPVAMAAVLACLVAFLSGRIGPKSSAEARRRMVPLARVSTRAWAWSLAFGAAGVIALAALWTAMAMVVRVPPNLLVDTGSAPLATLVPILIVSITAAPLTEEIAFRGYAMNLISRRFSPVQALLITTALFAAAHLTQGLSAPKLIVYFLAGLAFGLVALRTGSLLPAMVVHSFGDFVFFTLVWSQDAHRRLITEGGPVWAFVASLVVLAIAAGASLLAFRELGRATRTAKPAETLGIPVAA
jgi:membrane protease YdiL (CAAX protease family)